MSERPLGLGLLPPVLSSFPTSSGPGALLGRGWSPACPLEETPGLGQWAVGPVGLGRKGLAPNYRPAALLKDHCLPQTLEGSVEDPYFVLSFVPSAPHLQGVSLLSLLLETSGLGWGPECLEPLCSLPTCE